MSPPFETPQAAEDAFYDALEARNVNLMSQVWDDSPDVACMLPMQPIVHGVEVRNVMRDLLRSDVPLDLRVSHIRWVELGDVAIHYVEEHNNAPGIPKGVPGIYATNLYRRRGEAGWSMILHQNSPPPPDGPPPRR